VIGNKYVVHGTDELEKLLSRLPEEEQIHWIGDGWLERCWGDQYYGTLGLPDALTINKIEKFCEEKNLILAIVD
jgi:hypothetical protein